MAEIRIELGSDGIRRLVVRHDADRPDQGVALLDRAMPSLKDLHVRLRGALRDDRHAVVSVLIDGAVRDGVFVPFGSKIIASTDVETAAALDFIERLGLERSAKAVRRRAR